MTIQLIKWLAEASLTARLVVDEQGHEVIAIRPDHWHDLRDIISQITPPPVRTPENTMSDMTVAEVAALAENTARYVFVRNMMHLSEEEQEFIGEVMERVIPIEDGRPTNEQFDAAVDAARAAVAERYRTAV